MVVTNLYPKDTYPLGGVSLCGAALDWIAAQLKEGQTILEFGSGYATGFLAKRFKMISVEHNTAYLNRHPTDYIHAPLREYTDGSRWYDVEALRAGLDGKKYDLILNDGPGIGQRGGLLDNMDLFDTEVPIIWDDCNFEYVSKYFLEMARKLGRTGEVVFCGPARWSQKGKSIGVIPMGATNGEE